MKRQGLHGVDEQTGLPQEVIKALPPHLYPPVNFENIDQLNYADLTAFPSDATIISLQVPIGRNGIINQVACNFVGAGWVEGSGALIWRILVDGAPPPGAMSYDAILGSLGSPANPVKIAGFRVYENQVITVIASNVSIALAGQKVGARLCGWFFPREYEEESVWL